MAPALLPGDMLVVTRSLLTPTTGGSTGRRLARKPRHGEVWVYAPRQRAGDATVKRVVAIPGDTVAMIRGTIHLNGVPMRDSHSLPGLDVGLRDDRAERDKDFAWQAEYLAPGTDVSTYHPTALDWGALVVPVDAYFMLGDNRERSIDSRHNGFVGADRLLGRVRGIYFSYGPAESQKFPSEPKTRWSRFGRVR